MFLRFHVILNAAWTDCARITRKGDTSENEAIVLRFGDTVRQKENGVRAHSSGFPQTPAHIAHCRIYGCFVPPPPAKAPWFCLVANQHAEFYTYFQWTEDEQGFQIQYLALDM